MLFICRTIKAYAPHSQQPKLNRSVAELSENERIVYEAFTNEEFVNKLVNFLALEEVKGRDTFNHKKMILFKVKHSLFTVHKHNKNCSLCGKEVHGVVS